MGRRIHTGKISVPLGTAHDFRRLPACIHVPYLTARWAFRVWFGATDISSLTGRLIIYPPGYQLLDGTTVQTDGLEIYDPKRSWHAIMIC